MIKANRSNPKIRQAIPIPGCPPTLEEMATLLKDNGLEIDLGDYLGYQKYLLKKYESNPQFDPKDFFE